jgi:hypothetical protein
LVLKHPPDRSFDIRKSIRALGTGDSSVQHTCNRLNIR